MYAESVDEWLVGTLQVCGLCKAAREERKAELAELQVEPGSVTLPLPLTLTLTVCRASATYPNPHPKASPTPNPIHWPKPSPLALTP